jgi:hypothetical protein
VPFPSSYPVETPTEHCAELCFIFSCFKGSVLTEVQLYPGDYFLVKMEMQRSVCGSATVQLQVQYLFLEMVGPAWCPGVDKRSTRVMEGRRVTAHGQLTRFLLRERTRRHAKRALSLDFCQHKIFQ